MHTSENNYAFSSKFESAEFVWLGTRNNTISVVKFESYFDASNLLDYSGKKGAKMDSFLTTLIVLFRVVACRNFVWKVLLPPLQDFH